MTPSNPKGNIIILSLPIALLINLAPFENVSFIKINFKLLDFIPSYIGGRITYLFFSNLLNFNPIKLVSSMHFMVL